MKDLITKLKENKEIETIYGLRFDSSFKNVYSNEKNLKDLLQYLFSEDIDDSISFKNKELVKDNVNLKCGICDLIVETNKEILLIERVVLVKI